jgi:hypothetical protein
MCVNYLNDSNCCYFGPVNSPILFFRYRIIGGLKNQTVWMVKVQTKLTSSASVQFMASSGEHSHVFENSSSMQIVQALTNLVRPFLPLLSY